MKSRRDESEGMEKSKNKGKFSGNKSSSPTAYSKKKGPMATSAERYDAKKAYDKNLSASARMHYLENDIADKKGPKAYKEGPTGMASTMIYGSSADKVHRNRRGVTAMTDPGSEMKAQALRNDPRSNESMEEEIYTSKKGSKDTQNAPSMTKERAESALSKFIGGSGFFGSKGKKSGAAVSSARPSNTGASAYKKSSKTDKGIKGLGSNNKSGGKYI